MFFVIWTTLALIQLAQMDNVQDTNNVQMAHMNNVQDTNNIQPPLSYICDDDQIKEMAHELKFLQLMNENMQLKMDAFSMSINQQYEDIKRALAAIDIQKVNATASNASYFSTTQNDDIALKLKQIEMMTQNIQSKLEASDISINKQFKELRRADANKHEQQFCDCNAILKDLFNTSIAVGVSNTILGATFNANSTTSEDCSSASSSGSQNKVTVIPKFCQNGRSGIQSIHVPYAKLSPLLVNCIQDSQQDDNPWILIQRRRDGSVDFYRNWSDYQQGFGNLEGEFFMGLDKLHALTQSALYELWIQLEDFSNATRWARYSHFSIGDESQSYALNTLGNFTGNAGDSLTNHIGYKFTTKDKDNDVHNTFNCAKRFLGAWWYNICYLSNLNGKYLRGNYSKEEGEQGINWNMWRKNYSLKYVHMAIRPVKFS